MHCVFLHPLRSPASSHSLIHSHSQTTNSLQLCHRDCSLRVVWRGTRRREGEEWALAWMCAWQAHAGCVYFYEEVICCSAALSRRFPYSVSITLLFPSFPVYVAFITSPQAPSHSPSLGFLVTLPCLSFSSSCLCIWPGSVYYIRLPNKVLFIWRSYWLY